MRIVAISDLHSYHRSIAIPHADVLVCAGDITWRGELSIIEDFSKWLKDIPIKNKIVIFGNHEIGMQEGSKREPAINMIRDAGAIYLENSSIEIDGYKIFGSPVTPFFHDWEWNVQRGKDIAAIWEKIPDDTNILITHGPPMGIMDAVYRPMSNEIEKTGCKDLMERILELRHLKVHIFGHIHQGYGIHKDYGLTFVNASMCTVNYKTLNEPIVIDV